MVHQKNKLFKCSECSFETRCHNNLNEHIKIRHTRQDLVTQKMVTHEDVRKYKCNFEWCSFAAKQVSHLKRHSNYSQVKSLSVNETSLFEHKIKLY